MTCPNCGAGNADATKFCSTCGARLDGAQQGQQPQQVYQPAATAQQPSLSEPLTTGQFLLMDLVSCIPLVGLVMYFVWGFGDNTNLNRKSWARAKLIWALISTVLSVLFTLLIFGLVAATGADPFEGFGSFGLNPYGY